MPEVAATFKSYQQLQEVLRQLEDLGYDSNRVETAHASSQIKSKSFSASYDPTGGARISGSIINTLASTGGNLVGNSVTMDVELGQFPEILETLANDQPYQDSESLAGDTSDYLLTIDTEQPKTVRAMIEKYGGELVEITNKNM